MLYANPLADIARKHNSQFHVYADEASPILKNELPFSIQNSESISQFRTHLKHIFSAKYMVMTKICQSVALQIHVPQVLPSLGSFHHLLGSDIHISI